MQDAASGLPRMLLLETVWKLRIGSIWGSHEPSERGEKAPLIDALRYRKTRHPTRKAIFQTVSLGNSVNNILTEKNSSHIRCPSL
jgi:hypothetical protein